MRTKIYGSWAAAATCGAMMLAWACGTSSSSDDAGTIDPDSGTAGNDGSTSSDGSTSKDGNTSSDTGTGDSGPKPDGTTTGNVIRFAAIGDQGKGDTSQTEVAAAVTTKCKASGCDFVLLLGDNFYDNGVSSATDSQFKAKFEDVYKDLNMPFYPVLGNHDYGGFGTGLEFNKGKNEVDYTANSTKWKLPAAYWHRTEKHVEFFGLDTNMQVYGQDKDQRTDVAAWLAASTAKWKIALGHHPYLSNGPHGNAGSYDGLGFSPANGANAKSFMDEVVCGKVDLYLCGHDHSRQSLKDKCGSTTELMVNGTGSSVTDLKGTNATNFQANTLGFVYFVIQDGTLTADFIDKTGKSEYTRTLNK